MPQSNRDVAVSDASVALFRGEASTWLDIVRVIGPYALIALAAALFSDGVLQDDDLPHYQMARSAWQDHTLFLHDWGRPGFTVPYSLVAWIGSNSVGFLCSRLLTVAIAVAAALLTAATARRLGFARPEWAGAILMLIPLWFRLSTTTLTETICGLYFIAGTYCLLRDWRWAAAAILAVTVATRHEAIVFLVPVAVYFAWRRDFVAVLLLTWTEVVWNALAASGLYWMLPFRRYLSGAGPHEFGSGGVFSALWMWAEAVSPFGIVLMLAGGLGWLYCIWRGRPLPSPDADVPNDFPGSLAADLFPSQSQRGLGAFLSNSWRLGDRMRHDPALRSRVVSVAIVGGAFGMVLLQSVLFAFNRYASGGYGRFQVPAAPWYALCIHVAVVYVWQQFAAEARDRGISRSWLNPNSPWIWCLGGIGVMLGAATPQWMGIIWSIPQTAVLIVVALALAWRRGVSRIGWPPPAWLAATILIVFAGTWVAHAKPLRLQSHETDLKEAVAWIRSQPELRDRRVLAFNPWVPYFDERGFREGHDANAWKEGPPGQVLIYDRWYGPGNLPREDLAHTPHRRLLARELRHRSLPELFSIPLQHIPELSLWEVWPHGHTDLPALQVFEKLPDRTAQAAPR